MTDDRLVIVGENPHRTSVAHRPALSLTGSSGRNLCAWAGWPWLTYLRRTERTNLFLDPQPTWDAEEARRRAEAMWFGDRRVLLLGTRVARAFDADTWPIFEWRPLLGWGAEAARIPHPSGLNRAWNDVDVRTQAREFLGGLLG